MVFRYLLTSSVIVAATFAAEPKLVPSPGPRLAVVIAVDQFRADYLSRFRPYFGKGGFRRLLEGGLNFENCHYSYAVTVTAPGHATIATGVNPNVHGIVNNDWVIRDTWEKINNVEDRAAALVGVDPREMGPTQAKDPEKTGRSPRNLQATTVADQIKLRWGANSKVFGASNKDRSAILLGGKLADGAYWDELGQMITTTYYRKELPAWVQAFNAEQNVRRRFGERWDRLLDPKIYDLVQGGPDDAPGESIVDSGLTRTFPKFINGGSDKLSLKYYTSFDNSPMSAEFLGQFAERAIREEQLGKHLGPDYLAVSFSQIDTIGHSYGPDSHELMDSVLRLDRVLAHLLDCLDREVGLAKCVIVLTADHGSTPMPERVQALNPEIPAGRIKIADLDAIVRKALDAAYGPVPEGEAWFVRDGAGYHLKPKAFAPKNIDLAEAAKVVKAAVLTFAPVAQAYTRAEILALDSEGDSLNAMVRRSYYEPGGRDVLYVLKPYFMDKSPTGTTHGSAYNPDTNVPSLWFGAGVPKGVRVDRVSVEDIAPTLAGLMGTPPPPQARGKRLF
jgi:predicted AlkP superfamily pyrophosphatase or phosphodiesterase